MKSLFLLFHCLLVAISVYANDTLTRARVYNFNAGDTFDYKRTSIYNLGAPYSSTGYSFSRVVITNVEYSINNDTVIICRYLLPEGRTDTLRLSDLQHYEYYVSRDSACLQNYCQIEANSAYNGRLVNIATNNNCWEHYSEAKFADGLGKIYDYFNCGNHPPDPQCEERTELIYYCKGAEKWGTPYYITSRSYLLQYTPLPEECAIWTSQLGTIQEQIRTGNRIEWRGHAYVEMIYSNFNSQTGAYRSDSLIGYFRNDTLNQEVLFSTDVNATPFFYYDYKRALDGFCTFIDQISVAGSLRTRWGYAKFGSWHPHFTSAPLYYVQGIGGLNGLIPVLKEIVDLQPYYESANFASLTSFCVCGQAIYPNSSASCALLSAINEFSSEFPSFTLAPNPANGYFTIKTTKELVGSNFIISDVTGKEVSSIQLPAEQYVFNASNLVNGLYFASIRKGAQVITRKLVIQK